MSFWALTNNPSYWDLFRSAWNYEPQPPRALPVSNRAFSDYKQQHADFNVYRGSSSVVQSYSDFIKAHFSSTAELIIPVDLFEQKIKSCSWIVVEARSLKGQLIGIVVSKAIKIGKSSGGLVDYFCVEPSWRKKGVGSALLFKLHEITYIDYNRLPHIFASEGTWLFNKIPPFIQGTYYYRSPKQLALGTYTKEQQQQQQQQNLTFPIQYIDPEPIHIYRANRSHIVVKPTYEIYKGLQVAEVIDFSSTATTTTDLEALIDTITEFGLILVPSIFPRKDPTWQKGSNFAYYAFQFHPGYFHYKALTAPVAPSV